MMLLTHLFFVSSTFLMNSLIPISPLSRTVFFVAPITTLFWWAFYFFPNTNLFTQDIVASVYILIPLFSFLIVYDRLDQLTSFQKQLVMVGSVFCWGVCITNLLAILILNHSLINSNYIMIFNSLFFMFHSWILHRDQQAIQLSRFKFGIRNEVLFNVVGYCVFFTLYFSGLSQLKPYIPLTFYFMYFLLFLPYIFHFPIRSLRMYFQAMLFSIICIIVMKFHAVFDPFIMNGFHLDYIAIMTCLIGGLFLAATVYVFEFLVRSFDGIYPFSVVSKEVLQKCIELLNSTLNFEEIKQILNSNYLFKLHHFEIALWVIQHNQLRTFTSHLPELDKDLVIFLQYRDLIHVHELDEIMYHYGHTPFHTNVKQLTEFMKRHNIVQIRLLQQSNEMLGVMAIYALGKRTEILKSDAQLFHGLSDAISTAICNATSVNQFFTHQAMLEKVNTSISKFNVNDSLSDVVQLSRRTLLNIMPEIKFYIFLNYDPTSDFYKCGSSFNIHVDGLNFKLHSNFVRGHLKENVSCKFSINAPETPAELNAMMTLIDVKHALFIRVNDSDDSSIIILFFEKMIDLLDYRIPYCQVFLRHFEVFCDYQSNHDQVLRLRAFLQRLLDQLPTGVMIVNDKFKIDYLNSRMTTQLNDHNHQLLNQSIHDSDIHPMIINAVNYAQSNRSEFVQKIQIDQNGQQELHSLSAFSISQPHDFSTIIVLTNIQQSKELIDQMNQTNRLVMMSKIAKGISYELITPVQQLIDGVTRLNDCWQDPKFQDHFVTAVVPQVDRINLLCQSLLRLSRSNTESLVEIYLPDLLDQVLRLIAGDLRYSKHTFYVVHLDREKIVIDQVMAIQVLINLMIFSINSLAKDDSRLSLEIRTREPDKLFVKVGVQNYQNLGQLSDADLKDQLELSIVNQIVINQNGKFNVYSEQTIIYFEVILPIKYLDHVTPPIKSLTH